MCYSQGNEENDDFVSAEGEDPEMQGHSSSDDDEVAPRKKASRKTCRPQKAPPAKAKVQIPPVAELRDVLQQHGLSTTGSKGELFARLQNHSECMLIIVTTC